MTTKKAETTPTPIEVTPTTAPQQDTSLATIAMVLGVVSLTGPGLVFGNPEIILAAIALKKQQPNRGMSLTGLITGIISTALSLIFIAIMIFAFIWAVNNPDQMEQYDRSTNPGRETQQEFDSSKL
jgi:nitrogen fixation-related uncharacterized protein